MPMTLTIPRNTSQESNGKKRKAYDHYDPNARRAGENDRNFNDSMNEEVGGMRYRQRRSRGRNTEDNNYDANYNVIQHDYNVSSKFRHNSGGSGGQNNYNSYGYSQQNSYNGYNND